MPGQKASDLRRQVIGLRSVSDGEIEPAVAPSSAGRIEFARLPDQISLQSMRRKGSCEVERPAGSSENRKEQCSKPPVCLPGLYIRKLEW